MSAPDGELGELVRKYRVTWETRPEMGTNGRAVAPIGYVVELSAVGADPEQAGMVAAPDAGDVERALAKIVEAVGQGEVVHVGLGERELGASHDGRPTTSATVTVLHHDGKGDNRPQDSEEQERLGTVVERLRALGAQERHWRDEEASAGAK
jgi:hypothetical protein